MNNKSIEKFPGNIGIAWYKPEQWELLRAESVDSENLEDTYEEWLEFIEQQMQEARKAGIIISKVEVDVEEIIAWCRIRQRPMDTDARSEFVTQKMNEQK